MEIIVKTSKMGAKAVTVQPRESVVSSRLLSGSITYKRSDVVNK